MFFDGQAGKRRNVSQRGRSKAKRNAKETLRAARAARQQRAEGKRREKAASTVQAAFRGARGRNAAARAARAAWDAKVADVGRVQALLPPSARGRFALPPPVAAALLRELEFFRDGSSGTLLRCRFQRRSDDKRLSVICCHLGSGDTAEKEQERRRRQGFEKRRCGHSQPPHTLRVPGR